MPNEIEIKNPGLVKQPEDPRDYNFAFISAGAAPINWDIEYRLPEPPNKNQGVSDACVSYASSYFHWQFKRKDYSRRDLFSRIALNYGAYLRDGVKQICTTGQQTQDECADPAMPNTSNMRIKSSIPDAGLDDLEAGFFLGGDSIEQIAQAVRDFYGAVFGVYGDSAGWKDQTNPKPPVVHGGEWAHALYAMGYHRHSDGQRCIIAKSSYCNAFHHEHHIRENYFNTANVFNNWILVPKENLPMIRRFKVDDHGKLGVMLITDNTFETIILWAKNMDMYNRLLVDYEIPANAPTITIP